MTQNDPRGSIWRKWDLHVHTPNSYTQDFPEWPDYVSNLKQKAVEHDIQVMGVTDYFSVDGYEKLLDECVPESNRVSPRILLPNGNFLYLIPIIEVRLDNFTSDNTAVNLHIAFSPELLPATIRNSFLENLEVKYQSQSLKCRESDLIKIGHAEENNGSFNANLDVNNITSGDKTRLIKRALSLITFSSSNFEAQLDSFDKLLQKAGIKKDNYILIIANKGHGGLSDFKWVDIQRNTSRAGIIRQNLLNLTDICFSNTESDRNFLLGKLPGTTVEEVKQRFRTLTPCIWGSDAHSVTTLFHPSSGATFDYTWIKADPTFEGLKQIIYEPGRVYVGATSPQAKDRNRIISSVQVLNSGGWFDENEIPLNPDLCCVIGSKGSGKTALADIIGFAGGDIGDKISSQKSFLGKAINELNNTQIKIKWLGGHEDSFTIGEDDYDDLAKKVQYLSQGFVEKICSEDMDGEELIKEIEKVVFENLDEADKRNYVDFDSLREARTDSISQKKGIFRSSIVKLNGEIFTLIQQIRSLPEKKKTKEALEKEKEGIEKQKKDITYSTEEEKKTEESIDKLQQAMSALVGKVATLKASLQKITDVKIRIEIFEVGVKDFNETLLSDLKSLGIDGENLLKFQIQVNPDAKKVLEERKAVFEDQIKKLHGDETLENPLPDTLIFFEKEIEGLKKKSTLEKSKKDKLDTFQKRTKEIEIAIEKLTIEIEEIESTKSVTLEEKKAKRLEQYNLFFKALQEEREILVKLYEPIQRKLQGSTTSEEQLLGFETKQEVDHIKLADSIMAVLDRRKSGKFLNTSDDKVYSEIKEVYNRILNSTTDEDRIKNLMDFANSFSSNGNSIDEHLRDNYSLKDFSNAIFETEYFRLKYSLNFGGIALDNLTPGTKGIALLILYLGINQNEYRPLIIDQPEENLDNRSVYTVLKDYFRNAKLRRQIIMVTHNPNLVVNTDAEQVIVANFDKEKKDQTAKICYKSGSLENTMPYNKTIPGILNKQGIREHTCEILEGGVTAFEEREHKYRIN